MTAIQHRICDEVKRAKIGEVCNIGLQVEHGRVQATGSSGAESEYQREYRNALLKLDEDDKCSALGFLDS